MRDFFSLFRKPRLSVEAFDAYYHKLPDQIEVRWFRDSGMIIGEVTAGDKKFMTQGKDASDFVEMVNDAVYTVYEIPRDYLGIIKESHSFSPKEHILKVLSDGKTLSGDMLVKKEKALQAI